MIFNRQILHRLNEKYHWGKHSASFVIHMFALTKLVLIASRDSSCIYLQAI